MERDFLDASCDGTIKTVECCLEKGVAINTQDVNGNAAISFAASRGHDDIVRLLLKEKADANLPNNKGISPLIAASANGRDNVVRLLLDAPGMKVNAQDSYGDTAITSASFNGYEDIVGLLLDKNADVNIQDNTGFSPLMSAAQEGYLQIMKLLLDKGAKVDHKNANGNTALHTALGYSNTGIEAAKLLIDHGADLFVKNNNGKTPLDCAQSENIKNHVLMYPYNKLRETRKELATLRNLVIATTIGGGTVSSAMSPDARQYATLEEKLDKVIQENAQLRQGQDKLRHDHDKVIAQLHQENAQLQSNIDQLQQRHKAG